MRYVLIHEPLARPWIIYRVDEDYLVTVFTLVEGDEAYAREILDRLNHPALLDAPYEDDHVDVFSS